jgi:hypothetical protein
MRRAWKSHKKIGALFYSSEALKIFGIDYIFLDICNSNIPIFRKPYTAGEV